MEILKTVRSQVNVAGSIRTLKPGETLVFDESDVTIENVRSRASVLSKELGWTLSVYGSKKLDGKIKVERIA